jgi:hypothetical protein
MPSIVYCLSAREARTRAEQYKAPVNWFPRKLRIPPKALLALNSTAFKMVHPNIGKNIFTMKTNNVVEASSLNGISAHGLMAPSASTPKNRTTFRRAAMEKHMARRIISRLSGAIIITALIFFAM